MIGPFGEAEESIPHFPFINKSQLVRAAHSVNGRLFCFGGESSKGGPAVYNSIVRRKGVIVPFNLSKEELQQFYAFLDQLTIAILQEKAEEPEVPPRPALRLVKS
jgi:hypothetical protein